MAGLTGGRSLIQQRNVVLPTRLLYCGQMDWEDKTSYSQGELEPRVWEVRFGDLRGVVHRIHLCDGWFLSCSQLGLDQRALEVLTDTAEEAKRVGAVRLTAELEKRIRLYREAVEKLSG